MSRRRPTSQRKRKPVINADVDSSNESGSSSTVYQAQKQVGDVTNPAHHAHFLKSFRLYVLATVVLAILVGILLYAYGKLPTQLAVIAGAYATLIGIIAAIWDHIKQPVTNLWQEAHRKSAIFASIVTIIILLGIVLVYANQTPGKTGSSESTNANQTPENIDSSASPNAAPSPTWMLLLYEKAPFCGRSNGAFWSINLSGTFVSCPTSELMMQQTSDFNYAELDLERVKGGSYDPSTFRAQVNITFLNPRDERTWAGLLVQVPGASEERFVLAINAGGQWQLQYGVNEGKIPFLGQGGSFEIKSRPMTTVTMVYQGGVLYCQINGQYVNSYGIGDESNSSQDVVGLRVEQADAKASSPVLYSNFELDSM